MDLLVGGLALSLWPGAFTVRQLNLSVAENATWSSANNFSFVSDSAVARGCHQLGDVSFRARPAGGHGEWTYFSSAARAAGDVAPAVDGGADALAAHDLTGFLSSDPAVGDQAWPPAQFADGSPLRVTRTYARSPGGGPGFVLRFNATNVGAAAVELGALGFAMPDAGVAPDIEQSVWNDPHIGGDHGHVEWVRVVLGEQTMLAVPEPGGDGARFEAWRPVLENTCGSAAYEWAAHSRAWADEWATTRQWPYLDMAGYLNDTGEWPAPRTPWPAWHGHDSVPVTAPEPWNPPSAAVVDPGETLVFAIRFIPVPERGPRARDAALARAGKAVAHAVPGFVVAPDMRSARLFVRPPNGASVSSINVSNASVLTAALVAAGDDDAPPAAGGYLAIAIAPGARGGGRCRVSVSFSDGTAWSGHYFVTPRSFAGQVAALGRHWSRDAWLPREYPDPFGRSASVMPWDRERGERVLDDSRAYDVGLSDDAGGAGPLGLAIKACHGEVLADEVARVDEFIASTLYGVKPDVARPPLKSLQIRYDEPGMEDQADAIRMTMYYYYFANGTDAPNASSSGHWAYNYTEADKCGLAGIEGGPNWCMSEDMSNATYRGFNVPHHTATWLAMYRVARHHDRLATLRDWRWYLERAANTTIALGAPSVGLMDGTIFREVLAALDEEAAAAPGDAALARLAKAVDANMRSRAAAFNATRFPYGSEFAFDTTGQEEVVVWLRHYAEAGDGYEAAANRTVDHVLSYMRSSATWAYHGGARSWGDLGNNGKWMVTAGTASGFETRGVMHYRSGLNAIPLFETYRAHPGDWELLDVAMGAQSGQMANIDASGAPSMMFHALPHVLEFDPRSGDFGLGFAGYTLEAGAYFVAHPRLGNVCYLCDLVVGAGEEGAERVRLEPRDGYRQRVYVEPLGLYLTLDAGTFESLALDFSARRADVTFAPPANATYSKRRLRVIKASQDRPGSGFELTGAAFVRGAYEIPLATANATLVWE